LSRFLKLLTMQEAQANAAAGRSKLVPLAEANKMLAL
jgi:hypothetical protein